MCLHELTIILLIQAVLAGSILDSSLNFSASQFFKFYRSLYNIFWKKNHIYLFISSNVATLWWNKGYFGNTWCPCCQVQSHLGKTENRARLGYTRSSFGTWRATVVLKREDPISSALRSVIYLSVLEINYWLTPNNIKI